MILVVIWGSPVRLLWSDPVALIVDLFLCVLLLLFSAQRRRNEWNRLQGEKEPPTLSRTHRPARPAWGEEVSGVTQHHVSVPPSPHPSRSLSEAPGWSAQTRVIIVDSCWHLELIINNDPGREAALIAEDLSSLVPALLYRESRSRINTSSLILDLVWKSRSLPTFLWFLCLLIFEECIMPFSVKHIPRCVLFTFMPPTHTFVSFLFFFFYPYIFLTPP